MSRNKRQAWANGLIAVSALAGAVALTNHYTQPAANVSAPVTTANTAASSGTGSTNTAVGKTGTATSDAIQYQFGQVQVSVTEANGKITKIDYANSTATNGRAQAFPYLVQYAISAQGTNFSNISGATYTTDAFKQALNSAISKLG